MKENTTFYVVLDLFNRSIINKECVRKMLNIDSVINTGDISSLFLKAEDIDCNRNNSYEANCRILSLYDHEIINKEEIVKIFDISKEDVDNSSQELNDTIDDGTIY